MFALRTRSTRAAHILSLHARALSTIEHGTGSSNADPEHSSNDPASGEAATTRRRQTRFADSSANANCLLVFPWSGIRSSAEGFAIARAVQYKYGHAKEVIFPRNDESVSAFQPFFWLVYDDPDVRKHLPEDKSSITLEVADLPRSDGNVGLEEMMHGLGSHTTDPYYTFPPPPIEADKNTSDASRKGFKTLDIRLEWSNSGPRRVLDRKFVPVSHPHENLRPAFAKAWLAFDGFSPESARGPQTQNLSRAREKWRKYASAHNADENDTAEAVSHSPEGIEVEEVEAETESTSEAQTNERPSRHEWMPITVTPSTLHPQQPRPKPRSSLSKSIPFEDVFKATPANPGKYKFPFNAVLATDAEPTATATPAGTEETATNPAKADPTKVSRRERILNLARQNARTPLPKLPEKPQPLPEAEKVDEENERKGKERTIRERLWRLVGGNF